MLPGKERTKVNSANYVEEWRPVKGMNDSYDVSNMGRIRNKYTGNIRKPHYLPNGYSVFHCNVNGKRVREYVHRIVAEAFCSHPEGYDVVNHLDNDKRNNRADNLEWTTQFGNVHHGMKQNRYRLKAIPVVGFKDGKRYEFVSAHVASKETGCGDKEIIRCCKNPMARSKGFHWEYLEVV